MLLGMSACVGPEPDSVWSRHFDGRVWAGALRAQTEAPEKLLPTLALVGTTAAAFAMDPGWQEELIEGPLTERSTKKGDDAAIGLGVLSGGLALSQWAGGDSGTALGVLLESFVLVDGATELIKYTARRDRPDHTNKDSFPSGHTSFAFTMATLLARGVDDLGDAWYDKLGYLAYVPAVYVGLDRSEGNRHWPSDVAAGALLGFVLTNVVYDAHHGTARHPGFHTPASDNRWSFESTMNDNGLLMELVLRF